MQRARVIAARPSIRTELGRVDFQSIPGYFHEGQVAACQVLDLVPEAKVITILAGKQSGKTEIGPWLLGREIQLMGPGDYVVMAPRHPLLMRKPYPSVVRKFCRELQLFEERKADKMLVMAGDAAERIWGTSDREELWKRFGKRHPEDPSIIEEPLDAFTTDTRILFLHTEDPLNLEAGTYKGGWHDESGMPSVGSDSWRAMENRFIAYNARLYHTTTPYAWGLFKKVCYDCCTQTLEGASQFIKGISPDRERVVVRFESWMNPLFGKSRFQKLIDALPKWYTDMAYRGIFSRPQGQIYDCLDEATHMVPMLRGIPNNATILVGLDFGERNFAAVFVLIHPILRRAIAFHVYCPGKRIETAKHVKYIRSVLRVNADNESEFGWKIKIRGGNASEQEWRDDFYDNGLPVLGPTQRDPETRRLKLYNLFAKVRLLFGDNCRKLFEECFEIGHDLDEEGEPLPDILDENKYHRHAAMSYIADDIEFELAALYGPQWNEHPEPEDIESYRRRLRDST